MTLASIPEEDTYYRARKMVFFSHVQKNNPEIDALRMRLASVSFGALSDDTSFSG